MTHGWNCSQSILWNMMEQPLLLYQIIQRSVFWKSISYETEPVLSYLVRGNIVLCVAFINISGIVWRNWKIVLSHNRLQTRNMSPNASVSIVLWAPSPDQLSRRCWDQMSRLRAASTGGSWGLERASQEEPPSLSFDSWVRLCTWTEEDGSISAWQSPRSP